MTATDLQIENRLSRLGVTAPERLYPAVLVATGLADVHATMDSPIGPVVVAWNGRGVSLVDGGPEDDRFVARHRAATGRPTTPSPDGVPTALAAAIARRLGGDRRARVRLDLRGHTEFETDVWRMAQQIPYGEVRSYGWIAAEIGRPRAVRAVGTALGHNPVPLIVPCHRVVRADGTLGQYSLGGPDNKRAILRSEGLDPGYLEELAERRTRFVGTDTTHIVCFPTCRQARRITDGHRVPFHSLGEARAAGYRPCRTCRPASGADIAA